MSLILGNRIPYEYFLTKGKGESDAGSKGLPYETGSYDAALNDAGIENTNVIEYTSVIPTEAKEISRAEGLKRLNWGEVLECIKAQANGKTGSTISAAVMTTTIIDPNGKYIGGFACEYSGTGTQKDAEDSLANSIAGMIERRGYGKINGVAQMYKNNSTHTGYTIYPGKIFHFENLHITKEHGSVFVAICFVSHKYPIITTKTKSTKTKSTKTTKHKKSNKKNKSTTTTKK